MNEKGLTDLFVISRFECSTYLLGAASRAHHPVIKLKKNLRLEGAKISSEMADYK